MVSHVDGIPVHRQRNLMLMCAAFAAVGMSTLLAARVGPPWLQTTAQLLVAVVLPGALFGVVAWRILMRLPVRRQPQAFLEHAALATAFSAALTLAIFAISYPLQPDVAMAFARDDAAWQFAYGFVIYGAIAAAAAASRAHARSKERELAAASAELQALRARLDPHFLFNTLHSLTQLAREDPSATEDALERFGELMRYVLNAGRNAAADVPLEDELAFVRHYLALERLRLGDRLRVVESIDPEALELAVPPLLLQPLVENAVRHGLAPRRAGCTIALQIGVVEESLAIAVIDDGTGADPQAWRSSAGLGLQAVRRQIEARFPGEGRFDVATRPGAGFAVRLSLPARLPREAPG